MSVNMILTRPAELRRLRQGPLEPYLDIYAARATARGFVREIVRRHLWAVAHLSEYLTKEGLCAHELNEEILAAFLRARVRYGRRYRSDPEAVRGMLTLLREMGQCPAPAVAVLSPTERTIAEYHQHLLQERGLARTTIEGNLRIARLLLEGRPGDDNTPWASLSADDLTIFIRRYTHRRSPGTAKNVCGALRAFLRYLLYCGEIASDLTSAVPRVAHYKLATLPRSLKADDITRVLDHCDRSTSLGRRDYAVLRILARLGLRASEVVALTLDDIDWHSGQLSLRHTKSRSAATLPLPKDVGQAIADYLRRGRPRSASRRVFLRHVAPHTGFAGSSSIGFIVRAALQRAKVQAPNGGAAHLFRHGLATQMLRNGASLRLIGELLRHQHRDTTRIYAKVDLARLRPLALPWPGGAA